MADPYPDIAHRLARWFTTHRARKCLAALLLFTAISTLAAILLLREPLEQPPPRERSRFYSYEEARDTPGQPDMPKAPLLAGWGSSYTLELSRLRALIESTVWLVIQPYRTRFVVFCVVGVAEAAALAVVLYAICRRIYTYCRDVGPPLSALPRRSYLSYWWYWLFSRLTYDEEDQYTDISANHAEKCWTDSPSPGLKEDIERLEKELLVAQLKAQGARKIKGTDIVAIQLLDFRAGELSDRLEELKVRVEFAAETPIPGRPGPCVHAAVHHVWNKFPYPTRNAAQQRVILKALREYFEDRGMRPSHIRRALPIALELVYTPTEGDIMAKEYASSFARTNLIARLGQSPGGD